MKYAKNTYTEIINVLLGIRIEIKSISGIFFSRFFTLSRYAFDFGRVRGDLLLISNYPEGITVAPCGGESGEFIRQYHVCLSLFVIIAKSSDIVRDVF